MGKPVKAEYSPTQNEIGTRIVSSLFFLSLIGLFKEYDSLLT